MCIRDRYHTTKENLRELSKLQKEILSVVWKYVKPGGRLIYSTCTINKEENAENARWITENLPFKMCIRDSSGHVPC